MVVLTTIGTGAAVSSALTTIGVGTSALSAAGIGTAAAGAGLTVGEIANLLITVGTTAYSIASRPDGKDRRTEGGGFLLTDNPTDPQTPIPIPYGSPIWTPPRLMRYILPENLNEEVASSGEKRITVLNLGYGGPHGMDGGGLKIWRDDQLINESVTTTSDAIDQKLTPVGDSNRVFVFPHPHVFQQTATIYIDGTAVGVGGDNAGDDDDDDAITYNGYRATRRTIWSSFTAPGTADLIDLTIGTGVQATSKRVGCLLPAEGTVVEGSETVKVVHNGPSEVASTATKNNSSGGSPVHFKDVHIGNLSDGRQYLWVDFLYPAVADQYVTQFILSYKTEPDPLRFDTDDDGTTRVILQSATTGSVTATYKYAKQAGIRWWFRPGTGDQEPLPVEALSHSFVVGTELTVNSAVSYSSENEVTDVRVGLHSSPSGFFGSSVDGQDAGGTWDTWRKLQIRVKTSAAADALTDTNDPANGWVTLAPWNKKGTTHYARGSTRGTAKWNWSIADLLAWTKATTGPTKVAGIGGLGAVLSPSGQNTLPLDRYDVEITALDTDGLDAHGIPAGSRIQNKLFYAVATEVAHHKLTLPYVATLTIEETDPSEFSAEGVYRVQFKARKVWIPDAGASANATTGRPEPGTPKFSRNVGLCGADLIVLEKHAAGEFYTWPHVRTTWWSRLSFYDDLVQKAANTTETETRAELDIVLQHRSALHDHLASMFAGSRSYPMQSGGEWDIVLDQQAAVVMTLTDDDLLLGGTSRTWSSREERPDELEVAFNDQRLDYELGPIRIRPEGLDPSRRVSRRVSYVGVRRESQAKREGARDLLALQRNIYQWPADGASWRILSIEAGDFVTFTNVRTGASARYVRCIQNKWDSKTLLPRPVFVNYDVTIDNATELAKLAAQAAPTSSSQLPAAPAHEEAVTKSQTYVAPPKLSVKRITAPDGVQGGWFEIDVGSLS
jgi:hypothetical protein